MPDKTPENKETLTKNEDGYGLNVLPPVMVGTAPKKTGKNLHREDRHFLYCGIKAMELSDSDRPVSFSSTSSSTSSRDSHYSCGSRTTLVSSSHLGLFNQDKEAGAIKLELHPAQQFPSKELRKSNPIKEQLSDGNLGRKPNMLRKPETKENSKNCVMSLVVEPTSPKLLYVDRVVQEILETERTYVQDLRSIVKDYLDCITDQSKLSLGTEERSALFGNIKDIYHFNSELLQDLENCENDPVAIAECFVSKSEDFHIYTQYCTNYPRSVAVLTECMRNKSLAKFFRERQEALQHSLPLGSYLLKPVQRILKYHLLLHEIENHLDKETEGYDVVLDAIDTMQRVAWHINDMKRKHEHAIRLQEIQSLLTNWKGPDLASYGELVLEGTFRIQRAKNERTLFLFDKLLLITKKREETFTYKAHILCGNLMLVEVIPKEPLSFSVFHYKNPKMQHTVQAKSQQDKRLWILHLKRLILENHPAKIPVKAKQAILEMDAIHHPGFHYSPEEMKASSSSKEGITPQRMRRKSEPSSRAHKITKSSEMDPDLQKRLSTEGALLSQAELFLSPRKNHSLNCQRLDSNEVAYSSGQEDNILTDVTDQTDADDEEETEHNSQKCTDETHSQMNTKLSFSCSGDSQLSEQFTPQNSSFVANILGRTAAVRNIWTDHQIRQALFPSRRPLQDNMGDDDDDDDYQMFMPSDSTSNLTSIACEERIPSNRPCSWHVGVVHQNDISNQNSHRIMRRASSAGESKTGARYRKNYHDQSASWNEMKNSRNDMDNLQECQESSEELTIDDIDHVYDNISFEDLKLMGLAQREESNRAPQGSAKDSLYETYDQDCSFKKPQASQNRTCISSRNETVPRTEASSVRSYELRISEENIYDTIGLPEEVSNFKSDHLKCSKKRSFLGMETDFACCNQLRQFVSEESLQFSEDENPYHYVPLDRSCLGLAENSSNSDSRSHKSVADKLSEEVDEIWNDLENYIKKNEEKARDHALAAFPVCKDEVDNQASSRTAGGPNKDLKFSLTMLPLPEKSAFSKTLPNKVARLSEANIKFEQATSCKANSLTDLNRSSLPNDRGFADSLYESPNILCTVNAIHTNGELDSVDKTKNRVFMMARQYSQKIKKANQFLKVKSSEQEQLLSRQQKSKHKDLAAILEEKKQGGPAIGARIAEYSQLYDQIVFRETSPKTQKITSQETNIRYSSPVSTSHLAAECLKAENWLLHSTYSNGELSDFSPWPETPPLKTKSSFTEMGTTPNVRPVTCSVPSFQTPLCPHIPAQRWSAIINQPNKENLYHSHLYNSLGRTESNTKPQAYSRSQSSCSIVLNKSEESINYPPEMRKKHLNSNKIFLTDHSHDSVSIAIPGHSTCNATKQISENVSEVILQDSQKILRVKRNLPSKAQIATHNYFSNFKDTDNGEGDDDDYVEIKSEDEGSDLEIFCNQTKDLDPKMNPYSSTPSETHSGKLLDPSKLSDSFLTTCGDSDKLNDYLWSVPSSNQPNIVQSLREKFQCLSSSSFV
ncbi:pleckstrin homology domain-containing family G member 1 isoform X3 [Crotalus tigris]|uniref:pleckstrin homology domain-containing family G member 1 isoform X3 n=1 Tax=Crotalus tigris TaxID=88082 RepID=UPI00192F33B4|nr:pleckstrin homology domain-containing family G member 1 isoform X3 [Crotalus tigris]